MIFEIQDTIFPNKLKPLKPQPNYDITITILLMIFLSVRISSIIFVFIYISFLTLYSDMVKVEVLNFSNTNLDISTIKNNQIMQENNNMENHRPNKFSENGNNKDINKGKDNDNHLIRTGTIKSLNNDYSNTYSDYSDSYNDHKYLPEDLEPIMRLDMDEINKKIKAGDIFVDRKDSSISKEK